MTIAQANGSGRPGARILVVDDEASIVDAVATALRYEGFEVEEASTGCEALAAVARFDPDLIVLDWMLPDLEGDRGRSPAARPRPAQRDPLPDREGRGREQGRRAPGGWRHGKAPGDKVELGILRDGESRRLTVRLGTRPT